MALDSRKARRPKTSPDERRALVAHRRAEASTAFPEALPEDITTAATEDRMWPLAAQHEGADWRAYLRRMIERGRRR